MGNSASSGRGHHEDTVDFGSLTPQGIYTGPRDWNPNIVAQLICARKLAPFYRPLEDYEENWDDEQILAARKEPPEVEGGDPSESSSVSTTSTSKGHHKRPSTGKETNRYSEAAIYRGAVECPICFLYYPSNINRSRCCDQAICTECFVQIKRADPTTTHLVSEPAACPYCVQENFGVVYTPPPWRAGLGSEGATPPSWPDSPKTSSPTDGTPANSAMKRRRRSFGHDSPEVVTVDQIHPDWEQKLAAVRATVDRRANRRIIMRQVGDRLIPIGISSGRVHALPPEEGGSETPEGGVGRRSRRARPNPDLNQFLGMAGQDIEEFMMMEAMRLSLIEHEAYQRRQQEEEAKKQAEAAHNGNGDTETTMEPSSSSGRGSPPEAASSESANLPPLLARPTPHSGVDTAALDHPDAPASSPTGSAQFSALGAALRSAASVARAVTESEQAALTDNGTVLGESPHPRSPTPTTIVTSSVQDPPAAVGPSPPDEAPSTPRLPSFTSSLAPSTYDVLPSTPDSVIAAAPLLETPPTNSVGDQPTNRDD